MLMAENLLQWIPCRFLLLTHLTAGLKTKSKVTSQVPYFVYSAY